MTVSVYGDIYTFSFLSNDNSLLMPCAVSNSSLLKIKVRMVYSHHKLFSVHIQFIKIYFPQCCSAYFHLDILHLYARQATLEKHFIIDFFIG